MSNLRYQGRTAAEAAIKACEELNLTRSELKFEVVEDVGELLQRKVTIEITGRPEPKAEKKAQPAPERTPGIFDRDRDRPHSQSNNDGAQDEERQPRESDRAPRRERSRRERTPRNESARSEAPRHDAPRNDAEQQPVVAPAREERSAAIDDVDAQPQREEQSPREGREPRSGRGGRRGARGARGESRDSADAPASRQRRSNNQATGVDALLQLPDAPTPGPVSPMPSIAATSKRSTRAMDVVQKLTELMGLSLKAALVIENESELHIHLTGADEKRAIGQRGEVLLALQFITNRIISRFEDEGEQVLVLDAGGHRQRRQVAIETLARTLAQRALLERKAVRLSPMSAHDRRIFHMALKDMPEIATRSEGDGVLRNLLILPAEFCN